MGIDEVWENLLNTVIKYDQEKKRAKWATSGLVDKLFDKLEAMPEGGVIISADERPIKKAGFIYRVGVGVYEKGYYLPAIEILEHALSMYREIHNREGKEGIYACYGNICYCYRALDNDKRAKEYEKKTLEIEKQLKLTRDT